METLSSIIDSIRLDCVEIQSTYTLDISNRWSSVRRSSIWSPKGEHCHFGLIYHDPPWSADIDANIRDMIHRSIRYEGPSTYINDSTLRQRVLKYCATCIKNILEMHFSNQLIPPVLLHRLAGKLACPTTMVLLELSAMMVKKTPARDLLKIDGSPLFDDRRCLRVALAMILEILEI